MELSWAQVGAWRMERQFLSEAASADQMLDVVDQIGCVQAQVMSAAELQIGTRVRGVKREHVQNAVLTARTLVKTWAMRGTLHLITAKDYPYYIAALSTRANYRRPAWLKYFKVTLEELDAILSSIPVALDGQCLTREQLATEVGRVSGTPRLGELLHSGWGEFLKPAAWNGLLCFGPSQGQSVTFVRPDQWLGGAIAKIDAHEAHLWLVRKFLAAYGPAHKDEYARWYGVETGKVTALFKELAPELTEVVVAGKKKWTLTADLASLSQAQPCENVRLLPNFDVYTIGIGPHIEYLLPDELKPRVYRTAGWISPVVLMGGRVEGVWKYDKTRNDLVITVELFVPQRDDLSTAIEAEVERIGAFLGTTPKLVYGSIAT